MIRFLDPDEVVRMGGVEGLIADEVFGQIVDGKIEAMGGFVSYDGRLWVFTAAFTSPLSQPIEFIRTVGRILHARNQTVYAQASKKSGRFLNMLGFKATGEVYRGAKVYKWQHWQL